MLLAVFMLISAISVMFTVQIFADDSDQTTGSNGSSDTTETGSAEESTTGTSQDGDTVIVTDTTDYVNKIYPTPEAKLEAMRLAIEKDGYQLYVDDVSGEVAFVNTVTGDKIFTNPYDVGASTGSDSTKYEILSQIIVEFTDTTGQTKIFTSYEQAVLREQIAVEYIKNGIRVEYTIGREQAKTLVPRLISYDRFMDMIWTPLYEEFGDEIYNNNTIRADVAKVQKFLTYYILYAKESLKEKYGMSSEEYKKLSDALGGIYDDLYSTSANTYTSIKEDYKIIDSMEFLVFKPNASEAEIATCEEIILMYCPEYTYEELEYDHSITDYVSQDENPPVFRMALEYTIEEDGLSVRLPANGVRFNESLYTLESIKILPYMGAGNNAYSGYNFYPDGSGALFEYDDMDYSVTQTVTGKVYGSDYAYHKISGAYQETISYPTFGIVENTKYHYYSVTDPDTGDVTAEATLSGMIVDAILAHEKGETTVSTKGKEMAIASEFSSVVHYPDAVEKIYEKKHGFVAIIEEGDALASLTTYHAGPLSAYNTIMMSVTPRPKDSYNLQDSISVGSDSEWTVVSDRKYTGSYTIKYMLLSDTESLDKNTAEGTYDASWFGMAVAYRDYLTELGVISKLTDDEILNSIPLYIETFGAVETTEKILSIPVEVMTALTSFDDIEAMYEELADQGIKNVNFKLTGYTKGGMFYIVPTRVKFEKAVGGKKGFQELLDYANDVNKEENSNMGIYPDFDIAYEIYDDIFNAYSRFDHAAKTIDDRYASRREYSATMQKYVNNYDLVISPAYFYVIYEKITKNYANKYNNVQGISVSTLGSALNSDFDEDEPYNREDSKTFTTEAFAYLEKTYGKVMTEKANAYVWQYVDHMLGMALDSSNYSFATYSVPFLGVVLHGSVSFTGEALNMEGDIQYAILKAIENGASPYFILSYRNTHILKEESSLSKYYSVRYDIWKDDIVDVYNTLNEVLADVQNKYITNHEFLTGVRVPDADELEADLLAEYLEAIMTQENIVSILQKEATLIASEAREAGREAEAYAAEAIVSALASYTSAQKLIDAAISREIKDSYFDDIRKAYVEYYKAVEAHGSKSDEAAYTRYVVEAIVNFNLSYEEVMAIYTDIQSVIAGYGAALENSAFKAEFEENYEDYLAESVALVLGQYMTESEANAIAAGLAQHICDGHTGEDKSTLASTLAAYFEGNLDVAALNKICVVVLSDKQIKGVLEEVLGDAYDTTVTDETTSEELKALFLANVTTKDQLGSAISLCANAVAADLYSDIAENVFTSFGRVLISGTHSALNSALGSYNSQYSKYVKALATYNDAKEAYDAALAADGAEAESTQDAKKALDKAESSLKTAEANIKEVKGDVERALEKIELATTYFEDSAAAYLATESAADALAQVAKAGFTVDFADYMDVYEDFKAAYEYYYTYRNLAKANHASTTYKDANDEYALAAKGWFATIGTWYSDYAEKAMIKDELDVEINDIKDANTKGQFDNYIDALAKKTAAEERGYDDENSEWHKDYETVSNQVTTTRNNAVKELAKIQGSAISTLKKIFETAEEHFEKAMDAIDVLAELEKVTVEYAAGEENNPNAITNYDDIDSIIVRQAIDRACAVYNYLYVNSYEKIEEGRLSAYEVNGHKLYQGRTAGGERYYYYGTLETGYSYYTVTVDEATGEYECSIFHFGQLGNGTYTENGQSYDVRSYSEGGKKTFYIIKTDDNGHEYYQYLVENSYYGTYEYAKAKVYNGEEVATLEDGTVIYVDGDVYYSVNDDGTYTRYQYTMAIGNGYKDALADIEAAFETAFGVIDASGKDSSFKTNVENRINRDEDTDDDGDDDKDDVNTESKYITENIVAVTYGNDDGTAYKTIILNYNDYYVSVVYNGVEYTIPAYEFVVITD